MLKGTKELMVPLKREHRGINDDPQYSSYYPSEKYVVFQDYGHPDGHLASRGFLTKRGAVAWIEMEQARLKMRQAEAKAR